MHSSTRELCDLARQRRHGVNKGKERLALAKEHYMAEPILPLGKVPADLMGQLLAGLPSADSRVLVGPGPGLDCAVLDLGGEELLVLKSDPITFTAGDLGWYLVQVNANDIATTGATPRWLMATLLFPEAGTNEALVRSTFRDLVDACSAVGVTIIGGHTEITQAIDRPIAIGTLIGEVPRDRLLTPRGAGPGDIILLTKFVPIEAVAILCQELPDQARSVLGEQELAKCAAYHRDPGISIVRDAQLAQIAGPISAMHDPTEGGLAAALWELSDACGRRLEIDVESVPISSLARRLCEAFQIDPLAAISSGALLLTVPEQHHGQVCNALRDQDIQCTPIGRVVRGEPGVWSRTSTSRRQLERPERDEIARLFDQL